jgi:hypothetical protein
VKRALVIIILLLVLVTTGFSNDPGVDDTTGVYYEDLSHLLSVRIYPLAKINSLELKVPDGTISLQPNGTGNIGFGFNYEWLGFGFSVGLPASKKSIEKKGETGRFDMKTLDDHHRSINTLGVQLIARSAAGYEFKRFYMGLDMSVMLRNFSYNISEVNLGTGQVRLTFGKRFDIGRKK